MARLERPQSVVQRLRGHWRRSVSEPLWGRSAILAINRVLASEDEARLPHRRGACLGPESLQQLIASLAESAQIVSLDSALHLHHDQLPRIALTVDGGWRDVATQIHPVLERLAFPASIFLPDPTVRQPWMPDRTLIAEALWHDESDHGRVAARLAEFGLPRAPHGGCDERKSQAIDDYLEMLAGSSTLRCKEIADRLWSEGLTGEETSTSAALDAFTVRRLDQGGLLRFGQLSDVAALAAGADARRALQTGRQRLARLCREPLTIRACTDLGDIGSLDRFTPLDADARWLTRTPGWLEPGADTRRLPRFVIEQPLASSSGKLFDWLLGHLPA
ncbi:polysaccharide deacetylase family protein [Salinicola halophilus]|uniref:polysaccharide deacetylase family protein n=1 Tax=Salinicola halophilus TaxID=184065 RepID=UPI000DA15658|nr:polysaccharide deacetylase family protein [Salinicola halophilus]